MLSGDKGLSNKTLLDPTAIITFVKTYLSHPASLPKACVANFNRIAPALELSGRLTQIYAHQNSLQALCEAMLHPHPDVRLLDAKNIPALMNSLWQLILEKHHSNHWPLRTIYDGPFFSHYMSVSERLEHGSDKLTLDQLTDFYADELLFLGYFAFSLLLQNHSHGSFADTIQWMSKRTSHPLQTVNSTIISERRAVTQADFIERIGALMILVQHPGSTLYSFYDDSLKHYFAAKFVAACLMQTKDQGDLIDSELIDSVQRFIIENRENPFLDEFWCMVYEAFPPHSGAHARADFAKLTIITRTESTIFLTNLFKLIEHQLPAEFQLTLTINSDHQCSIKSPRSTMRINDQILNMFDHLRIHLESRGVISVNSSGYSSELTVNSSSAQEIQNFIFAFKQTFGAWIRTAPTTMKLFDGHAPTPITTDDKKNTTSAKH